MGKQLYTKLLVSVVDYIVMSLFNVNFRTNLYPYSGSLSEYECLIVEPFVWSFMYYSVPLVLQLIYSLPLLIKKINQTKLKLH